MDPNGGGFVVPLGHEDGHQDEQTKQKGSKQGHDKEGSALNAGKKFTARDQGDFVHDLLRLMVRANCFDKDVLEAGQAFGKIHDTAVLIVMLDDGWPIGRSSLKDQTMDGLLC